MAHNTLLIDEREPVLVVGSGELAADARVTGREEPPLGWASWNSVEAVPSTVAVFRKVMQDSFAASFAIEFGGAGGTA
jgi:hypothetical protein